MPSTSATSSFRLRIGLPFTAFTCAEHWALKRATSLAALCDILSNSTSSRVIAPHSHPLWHQSNNLAVPGASIKEHRSTKKGIGITHLRVDEALLVADVDVRSQHLREHHHLRPQLMVE